MDYDPTALPVSFTSPFPEAFTTDSFKVSGTTMTGVTIQMVVNNELQTKKTGNNRTQVQAMADEVEQKLGRAGAVPKQIEGYQAANWVLLDFGDVIIHIFDAQNRLFYDLERIWKDGRQIDPEAL